MDSDCASQDDVTTLRDHVDSQHKSVLDKLTFQQRWILSSVGAVIVVLIGFFMGVRESDKLEVSAQVERNNDLVHKSYQQSMTNAVEIEKTLIIIGAGLDKSNREDKAILDKLLYVEQKNSLQIEYLKDKIDDSDKK